MKSQVLHTVWCNNSDEAAGEIWNWSPSGAKGLKNCAHATYPSQTVPWSRQNFRQVAGQSWDAQICLRNRVGCNETTDYTQSLPILSWAARNWSERNAGWQHAEFISPLPARACISLDPGLWHSGEKRRQCMKPLVSVQRCLKRVCRDRWMHLVTILTEP